MASTVADLIFEICRQLTKSASVDLLSAAGFDGKDLPATPRLNRR